MVRTGLRQQVVTDEDAPRQLMMLNGDVPRHQVVIGKDLMGKNAPRQQLAMGEGDDDDPRQQVEICEDPR